MTNADLIDQLQALTTEADGLREDLARSEDMPALSMVPALVKAMKVNGDLGRLAKAARKQLTPLFGRKDDDQADGAAPKPRPKK